MSELPQPPSGEEALFSDVVGLINGARSRTAATINSELVTLYWNIGRRIRENVLGGERAEYGQEVVRGLARRLAEHYGRGYSASNLSRMVHLAELYPDGAIVATLSAQLTWSHFVELLKVGDSQRRDFCLAFAARERWSVRALRSQMDAKLFERTLAARGSADGLEDELAALRDTGTAPGLVFHDPYLLGFLGLPPVHSEADLEKSILDEMWRFIVELGAGFAFVARQKRITVDGDDHYLDLLFYHLGMRCYVAVELKTHKLQPGDYGQMLLYLRWLDANERGPADEAPVGLILCTEVGAQQAELLGLGDGQVRAARYITEPMRRELLDRVESTAADVFRRTAAHRMLDRAD